MSPEPSSGGPSSSVLAQVAAHRVVPIVEVDDVEQAVPLARTLAAAGLPLVEVTFRTRAAEAAVAAIAAELPEFLLGAGTLLDASMVRRAGAAGARFGVAPGTSAASLAAAEEIDLPFVPGIVTPSELLTCLDAGARYLKFFPAGLNGGAAGLRALAGPFAWTGVRFMPTGGVRPGDAAEYLALPEVYAVGGTWIAPREEISAGRWDAIGERAEEAAVIGRAAGAGAVS